MCTAIHLSKFFGRNLDWEHSFNEQILITPQNFPLKFCHAPAFSKHYAFIGTGISYEFPLYFDAVNEKGLAIAGLNFPHFCKYRSVCEGVENVASFEIIPYILSQCATAEEARKLLSRINITCDAVSADFTPSPLHFIIADTKESIVLEQTAKGRTIYENNIGVLTNSPSFDMQLFYLSNFLNITAKEAENRFSDKVALTPYSRGLGAFSLPGDFSSSSRFVKAAFLALNSLPQISSGEFFEILGSLSQIKGAVYIGDKPEYTIYSSCIDLENCIYYYKTYGGNICEISLKKENFTGKKLIFYPQNSN